MIIEYATKEIRDCVLRDLWLEVSAGRFEKKVGECELKTETYDYTPKTDKAILIRVPLIGYDYERILKVKEGFCDTEIDIECINDEEGVFTICDIINFLKAGAKNETRI